MGFGAILYTILIRPLQLFFEVLFMLANKMIDNPGMSIIVLSLAMNFLVLPLYRRADAMQEEEREIENKLHAGVSHIKKTFKGDERMMILQTYYRQNNYKPTDVFKGSISLFLEIPFFIAAYQFLSHLEILQGVSFGVISDLGAPDALIHVGSYNINLLPIVMTGVNLISCVIFTKGYPLKTKVQLYSMAIFFFFFLYTSPAGLVFYWTLNNVFSLVKTIFYKLKNPKKVLEIMFSIIGLVLLVFTIGFYDTDHIKFKLLVGFIGAICIMPLVAEIVKKNSNSGQKKIALQHNGKVFWSGVIYMVVMIGAVIPSAVIKASPQEFADINYFLHPLWYICSAICFAIGTFVVWLGVFYWLASKEKKVLFDTGIWVACGIITVNYMFFGKNLGLINNSLQYEEGMSFGNKAIAVNIIVMILVIAVMILLYRFTQKHISQILIVASIALAVMSGGNMLKINDSIGELSNQIADADANEPRFTLSKNGKNVIVFMLDRAMNEYIPYFINEKPELKEIYSGFTYYANTVSFGAFTNFGTPALYGGYEYTPVELNARETESLASKQTEAVKVMPVIFDNNDFEVTVCDPTYANYQWVPDLSIYDDYPDISAYNTDGKFADTESKQLKITNNKRNFFCYSMMKVSPLFMQNALYNEGNYNSGSINVVAADTQVITDNYTADGISSKFMDAFSVLQNLVNITDIKNDDTNTFLMISNNTTHEPMLLQEPDYTVSEHVDNTDYEENNKDRYTVDGVTLNMNESNQYIHYQSNMAALLEIGKWLQYMKDNDVYDNTRIIIVADHGRPTNQLDSLAMEGVEEDPLYDAEFYYPLLMVKDFDSEEFTTSEEFMTNGDVPTLATQGVIDNPTNPFTGKQINNNEKFAHDQYIFGSDEWSIADNSGNTFIPGIWFSVHDDMRDINNWSVLQTLSTSPFEQKE